MNKFLIYTSIFLLLAGIYSCSKSNYLKDGGTAKAQSNLSAYDYLAANAYHQFDTLLLIVDHFNLKDSVNSAGTFFAPTDYSIRTLMTYLDVSTLDSLYPYITSKFITQYLFSDTLSLSNATTSTVAYPTWADTLAGVKKIEETEVVVTSTIPYYMLEYVHINGYIDGDPNAPPNDPTDQDIFCQTEGIITKTGSKLNVLSNAAALAVK